jgi:hypothetical protein
MYAAHVGPDTGPLGGVTNERGEWLVRLDRAVVDGPGALRGPGESYSDVILRLVEMEGFRCRPCG